MPFVHVRTHGPALAREAARRLAGDVTALMETRLGKRADLTAVLVEPAVGGLWTIGGEPTGRAAHLVATVTAGTNTPAEKAGFVEAAHALLEAALGRDLPLATYVVVEEIAADAWGYGGRTQRSRRVPA